MSTTTADPLADIPNQEEGAIRDDWRELVFQEPVVLTDAECASLKRLFARHEGAGRGAGPERTRRIDEVWLGGQPQPKQGVDANTIVPDGTEKLAYRISGLIQLHNIHHWNFNIIPFPKMCISSHVMLDRQAADGTGMDWHSDYTCDPRDKARDFEPKIVAIIQLSAPSEYQGGQLEIYSGRQIVRPKLEMGDMVLFPNFLLHRRQPVTAGVRFGMLTLAWGACWR